MSAEARALLVALFDQTIALLDPSARVEHALGELRYGAGQTVIVAAGKAARAMARGALGYLDGQGAAQSSGVVIAPSLEPGAARLGPLAVVCGSHPVPDARSREAARAALAAVRGAPADARILALISGGGSALMAAPAGDLSLAEKVHVTRALAERGATIQELNAVRKHLSAIKGGQLARAARAPVTTLIASDVVGDDPSVVASGPTVADPSTFAQAVAIVERTLGWEPVPARVRAHLERGARGDLDETPKRERPGDRVRVIAGTGALIDAAVLAARDLGVQAGVLARGVTGDVAHVAEILAEAARRAAADHPGPRCLIAGGEPTVAVPERHGRGGRAHQLALLVARAIAGLAGVTVLIAGSDGIDGDSGAAGAIVDGSTSGALAAAGVDTDRALAACDAATALAAVGASLVTGPTGVNHADVMVIASGFSTRPRIGGSGM